MLKVHGRQLDKPDWCCVQGGLVVVGNSCAQNVNVFLYFYQLLTEVDLCSHGGHINVAHIFGLLSTRGVCREKKAKLWHHYSERGVSGHAQ